MYILFQPLLQIAPVAGKQETNISNSFNKTMINQENKKCPRCGAEHICRTKGNNFFKCYVCDVQWEERIRILEVDELEPCPDCWGTGRVYAYVGDKDHTRCNFCKGTGWL